MSEQQIQRLPPTKIRWSRLPIVILGTAAFFMAVGAARSEGGAQDIARLAIIGAALALYFAPTFAANTRGNPNRSAILVLNILLGWTVLGWIAALVWAFAGERRKL